MTGAPLAAQAPAGTVDIRLGGQRAELALTRHFEYAAVSVDELASLWGMTTRRGAFARAELAGDELVFEAGSPFFRLGEATYQLANAPYEWGGAFWKIGRAHV